MEYLTIHEPRSSHFRGMEPYKPDPYALDGRQQQQHHQQDKSRSARSPRGDRMPSPPYSHNRSDPGSATSASEWRRWPQSSTPPLSNYPEPSSERLPAITTAPETAPPMVPTSYGSAPRSQTQPPSPEWSRPPQPTPARPGSSTSAFQSGEPPERQEPLKLPSFNSLVKQLSSETSPISPASSSLPPQAEHWKRPETSIPPQYPPPPSLEPIPYPLARPSGGPNLSSPTAHHLSASEPPSPQVYSATSTSHPPFSPRGRPTTPARRSGHNRRSSDLRSRTYQQGPPPPPPMSLGPGPPPPVGYPGPPPPMPPHHHHHHRSQTFSSYPPPPSYKSDKVTPYPPQAPPPPQQLPLPEYRPQLPPSIPPPPPQPAAHPSMAGHGRTDSVLTEAPYYPNGGVAPGPPGGPPGSGVGILHVHHHHHQQRKRRGNLPKDATMILRRWFDEHLEAPYPGEEVKHSLCLQTGLQMSQVNNWFINARRRLPRVDPAAGGQTGGSQGPGNVSVNNAEPGRRSAEPAPSSGESPTRPPQLPQPTSASTEGSHRPHDFWR